MVTQPHPKQLDLQPPMCPDCQALKGAGRHAAPHANLYATTPLRKFGSIMGNADEQEYKCRICGTEWLHESGSCGMGWL